MGAFISSEYKNFQYCPQRMHTGNGTVERAVQTLKKMILANMEDGNNLTESINRALKVLRFTIHTGLKKNAIRITPRQKIDKKRIF